MDREKLTFDEAKMILIASRGVLVEMLDLALEFGDIKQRDRDIVYFRLVDWNSLERTAKEFGVTRERIRQIVAKVEETIRQLTKTRNER